MSKRDENKDFKFTMDKGWGDFILEEGGNTSINLRMVSWNDGAYKLDIRKYSYENGREIYKKGIRLNDKGGHELATRLVEKGYGDTFRLFDTVRHRNDWSDDMLDPNYQPPDAVDEEDFYDPAELLNPPQDYGMEEDYDSPLLNTESK